MSDEWKITESLPEEMKSLRLEVARLKEAGEDQYRKILQLEQDCERYRLACLAARDAFGDWDIVADRMWCSEGMRTILGVPEVVEHAYDWWVRCMHPDDREIMIARLKRALDGKDVFDESEFRVRTAQDAYIDIIFRIFIKRDKDGKPLRMLGLAADNSHRKKIEAELRQSEERYRTIIENMEDGYHETDLKGNFTYFNDACGRNMGRSREEMIGKSAWTLSTDEASTRLLLAKYREVFQTGIPIQRFEHDILRSDGAKRTLETSVSLITSAEGRPIGYRGISRDTTDRKQSEEDLKRYANEISDLYHNAPCGYHSLSPNGTFLKINNTELSWLGYTSEEIIGKKNWRDLLTPEGIRVYERTFPVLKDRDWIDSVELDLVRKDGTLLPVHLNATAIRDARGNFVMSRSTLFDMTERKRMESELRENEQLYWTALDQSNDGIMLTRNGRYIYVNQKFLDTFGRTREEIVGRTVGIFSHPDDRPSIAEATRRTMLGQPIPRYEIQGIKPDGTIIHLEVSTTTVIYKGERAGFSVLRDITVKKSAEMALKESEEKYRSIIERMTEDYFEVDMAGNLTFFNEAVCKTHDRARGELMGLNCRDYARPEEAERILNVFDHMFRTGISGTIMDFEIIRKDGRPRYLEISISPVRDASGKPTGARVIGRDITERKRLEEDRKKLSERLNQSQKMEAIGTLAGGIAHDFNNILASIMGFTELMELRIDDPDLNEYIEQILKACGRAKNLINQILTFGQKKEREIKEVDLNPVFNEMVKLLRATLPSTIEIRVDVARNPHAVLADTTEIHQIVMNLSTNAAHAMREKGGILELALRNIQVNGSNTPAYADLKPGAYVELSVKDNGEGIDSSNLGRIFDPFFTTKERGKGTGLGLSVVYGIAKEYGGGVTVQSEPGEGSVFCVYLPAFKGTPAAAPEARHAIPEGTERILFVDDEETLSMIGKEMLEHLGYHVVSTTSSVRALELFRADPKQFDLVITDLTMPSLTGIDLAREIMKLRPGMPIILSTGYSDLITEEESRQSGIRVFFMKPFSLEQMAHGVRRALAN